MKKTILLCLIAVLLVGTMVSCIFDFSDKSYKVTYDYGYENKKLICFVLNGSSALPITISRAGYKFNGWYSDVECINLYDFTVVLTKSITLYAKWDESAAVLASAGRTECGWVQLWEGGPKWAKFNVGSTVNDYASVTAASGQYTTANVGGLYSWGGTNERREGTQTDDNNTGTASLTGETDTATKLWGNNWKMPTKENLYNLINKDKDGTDLTTDLTTWEWCDGTSTQYVSGCTLAGFKVSGKGDYAENSIFIPAAGLYNNSESLGKAGLYWSSTPDNASNYACILSSDYQRSKINILVGTRSSNSGYGLSVRPVLAE